MVYRRSKSSSMSVIVLGRRSRSVSKIIFFQRELARPYHSSHNPLIISESEEYDSGDALVSDVCGA